MPDFDFHISGARAATDGLTPLMVFDLEIENDPPNERIQSVLLQTQVRIEAVRRRYDDQERERLLDLFGRPEDWGRTLRDLIWSNQSTTVPSFNDRTTVELTIPCTFDLNVAATKYFYGIEGGEIPLVFLFTGTVLYSDGSRTLIQRISWDKECRYRMPVERWKALMDEHYAGSAWMYLDRDLVDRLFMYKQRHGCASWNDAIARLLAAADEPEVAV